MRETGQKANSLNMDLTDKLEIACLTDVGMKRPHNEDSLATDAGIGFAIVADGMGGYKAGEVASSMAVTSIHEQVREGMKSLSPGQIDKATGYTRESVLVQQAIVDANARIFNAAREDAKFHGMGTTVVTAMFFDNQISVAHVGDSRLYRLRNDMLEQITSDHSLMQELVDRGFFTPEEAAVNTPKNLVTRALGIEQEVQVDIHEDSAEPGDIYLMCTDGLNDMVDDEEIHLTLSKYSANLAQAAENMVSMANDRGGRDNISVILMRPREPFPAQKSLSSKILRWFG